MSNYIPKPDTGTLFHNHDKSKETQPDYTGKYAMPDGTVRRIAAWINPKGYLSVKFQDQYESPSS